MSFDMPDGAFLEMRPDLFEPTTPPNLAAVPKPCRHRKEWRTGDGSGGWACRCGHAVSGEKVRQGRRTRSRGNAKERAAAKRNGTQRTGHHGGKDDFRAGLFAFQNKSMVTTRFPGWMTTELDALRLAWPHLEPVLHVEESPGPGRKARRLYVMDETTWFRLHGDA